MKTMRKPRGRIEKIVYLLQKAESSEDIVAMLQDVGASGYSAKKYLAVIAVYAKDQNPEVRIAAIKALCNISKLNSAAIDVLIERIVDRVPAVRYEVYVQLCSNHQLRNKFFLELRDDKLKNLKSLEMSLLEIKDVSGKKYYSGSLWDAAHSFLLFHGEHFIPSLIRLISSEDIETSNIAVSSLSNALAKKSAHEYRGQLAKKVADLKRLFSMGKFTNDHIVLLGFMGQSIDVVVPILVKCLDTKSNWRRNTTIEALHNIGRKSLPYLLEAVNHKRWAVRSGAILALAKIGVNRDKMISILYSALNDRASALRGAVIAAAYELGESAADDTMQIFLSALGTPYSNYRSFGASTSIYTMLSGNNAIQPIYSSYRTYSRYNRLPPLPIIISVFYGGKAVPELINIIGDRYHSANNARISECLLALAQLRDEAISAIPMLVRVLNDGDYMSLQYHIIMALLYISVDESLPHLIRYWEGLDDKSEFERAIHSAKYYPDLPDDLMGKFK